MPLRLREDVFWCLCHGRAIFLDLRHDRYLCLPPAAEPAFRRLASGGELQDEEALRGLIGSGLLLRSDSPGDFAPALVRPATDDFLQDGARRSGLAAIAGAVAFEALAAWRLRQRSLLEIVDWEEGNGVRASRKRRSSKARLEAIVSFFARPGMLVPAAGRCLVRALAAHAACCSAGFRPRLVFGVGLDPFRAHAWVQLEDKVLVGDYEQVRLFTPIAAFG